MNVPLEVMVWLIEMSLLVEVVLTQFVPFVGEELTVGRTAETHS